MVNHSIHIPRFEKISSLPVSEKVRDALGKAATVWGEHVGSPTGLHARNSSRTEQLSVEQTALKAGHASAFGLDTGFNPNTAPDTSVWELWDREAANSRPLDSRVLEYREKTKDPEGIPLFGDTDKVEPKSPPKIPVS